MIALPKHLKKFQSQASKYLSAGHVRDIEFAGGTYQVLVFDPETQKEEWAFLQLDGKGKLKDSFCSCYESEAGHECLHLAASLLYINGQQNVPLHIRFESSLWNHLFLHCSECVGTSSEVIKKQGSGRYSCRQVGGKNLFSIVARTAEAKSRLEQILFDRKQETEETSLKFSNLSPEEIALWRGGRPTPKLSYELSFWNDLAKLLMFWQEEGLPYDISFNYSANKLPNRLNVEFPELELEFYLSEEYLPTMIPALGTVKSPLVVHNTPSEEIAKIIYHKNKRSLEIISKNKTVKEPVKKVKGIEIPGWTFISEDGFYARDRHFLLTAKELTGKDLEEALSEHAGTIKSLIEGCIIHDTPVPLSYMMTFDSHWNLHIFGYLFAPNDLSTGESYRLGSWAYLDGDGFYRLEEREFEDLENAISANDVSDFVTSHRAWLNNQTGFATHISHLEADISYKVNKNHQLIFARQLQMQDEMETKDFGRWVYIKGQGFFAKKSMQSGLPIQAGRPIAPDQVSVFIRENYADLCLIKHFFIEKCPIEKAALNILLNEKEQICVIPEYQLLPEYKDKPLKFFDDFIYVEGEGFYEIPFNLRLPEQFREPVIIGHDQLPHFLQVELPTLESFANTIDPRLRKASNAHLIAGSIEHNELEGKGDYSLRLKYATEFGAISVTSLWWSFKQKRRFVFSEAGLVDLSDKRFSWFKTLKKDQVDRRSNNVELTTLELMRLNASDEIMISSGKDAQRSKELLDELKEGRVSEAPDLTGLKSTLRPYQEKGVDWLWFLYRHGLSGLLCDDMGLGKTHQTMALLVAVTNYWRRKNDGKKRHFLIICPTSVIYHWQEKLNEFLPELKVWSFYGTKRSLESFHQDSDILLTSYGVWRNEAELLKDYKFEVAIFDEIQIAKNHTSRIYNTLTMANARMRIGLSGTPIENHLRELKTLFDITLPNYMPGESDYREHFVRPIEKEGNRERKALLTRMIKPFVMRRKKEDVLTDLPEKIEEIAHCDLLPEQHKLYMEVLKASRDKIIDELNDDKAPIPYMHIFALFSHLKQICNHPATYLKQPGKYKHHHSGKWALFVELLKEARASQQKLVVFSQYLYMLDIIESYLTEHGIGFATIRGATVNRGEQLHQFKTDSQCEVFIASLQAAGLGVDLTSASVVVHYDRWWNAAKENQATDRVHRIGQVRGVQVFKLMVKDTIEEHIDRLIIKKGQLMEDIVGVDDHQILKKFDRQEIIQLLQMVPG